ncbi:MAG: hypothetical protein AVDCRST_MAG66-266, partial [uncultured Pseudonocardia sp.]
GALRPHPGRAVGRDPHRRPHRRLPAAAGPGVRPVRAPPAV